MGNRIKCFHIKNRKTTGRVWKKGRNLYDSTGYSGKGFFTWLDILSKYRRENKIVIPSIYTYEKTMLWKMTRLLQQIQVPAIEIGFHNIGEAHLASILFLNRICIIILYYAIISSAYWKNIAIKRKRGNAMRKSKIVTVIPVKKIQKTYMEDLKREAVGAGKNNLGET